MSILYLLLLIWFNLLYFVFRHSIMEEKEIINENKKSLDEKMEVLSANMDDIKNGKEEKESELKLLMQYVYLI